MTPEYLVENIAQQLVYAFRPLESGSEQGQTALQPGEDSTNA